MITIIQDVQVTSLNKSICSSKEGNRIWVLASFTFSSIFWQSLAKHQPDNALLCSPETHLLSIRCICEPIAPFHKCFSSVPYTRAVKTTISLLLCHGPVQKKHKTWNKEKGNNNREKGNCQILHPSDSQAFLLESRVKARP